MTFTLPLDSRTLAEILAKAIEEKRKCPPQTAEALKQCCLTEEERELLRREEGETQRGEVNPQ